MYTVLFSESTGEVVAMLVDASYQVRRNTDIECPVAFAGENIDIRLLYPHDLTASKIRRAASGFQLALE
jgi:hypothetical protein